MRFWLALLMDLEEVRETSSPFGSLAGCYSSVSSQHKSHAAVLFCWPPAPPLVGE